MSWYDTVWNSFSIPKCSFFLWLALQNRLLTKDRMILYNMNTSPGCLFCSSPESIIHLFTDCPFFRLVRLACPIDFHRDWSQCQLGNIFNPGLDEKRKFVGSLYLAVAVYLVWKERNYRIHNVGPGHGSLNIVFHLKQMVREKLFSCRKFKKWIAADPFLITLMY